MSLMKSLFGTTAGHLIGKQTGGRGLMGAGIGYVATRIATRSVPGALIVGGGLLAKTLYDRKKQRDYDKAALNAVPARPAMAPGQSAAPDFTMPEGAQPAPLDPLPPRPVERSQHVPAS